MGWRMRATARHPLDAGAGKLRWQPIFSFFDECGLFAQYAICAIRLTNFFDLSNIRVEPLGASEMLGSSRWSREMPFQFDGQPAPGADLFFTCVFSTPPKNVFQFEPEQRVPACASAELGSLCGVARDNEFRAGKV